MLLVYISDTKTSAVLSLWNIRTGSYTTLEYLTAVGAIGTELSPLDGCEGAYTCSQAVYDKWDAILRYEQKHL